MERAIPVTIVGLGLFLLIRSAAMGPAPKLGDVAPVPTQHQFPALRGTDDADAFVVVQDHNGLERRRWLLDDGQLYGPVDTNNQPIKPAVGETEQAFQTRQLTEFPYELRQVERTAVVYHAGIDLGTWAGLWSGDRKPEDRFAVGVRCTYWRLAYETLAPDLVVSGQGAGFGVSFYPPRSAGRIWSHLGIGAWYLYPYSGGSPGLCLGLSFSTVGR